MDCLIFLLLHLFYKTQAFESYRKHSSITVDAKFLGRNDIRQLDNQMIPSLLYRFADIEGNQFLIATQYDFLKSYAVEHGAHPLLFVFARKKSVQVHFNMRGKSFTEIEN